MFAKTIILQQIQTLYFCCMYKLFVRPFLFLFSPEKAHHVTFAALQLFCKIPFAKNILRATYQINHPKLRQELFGLIFSNPVGLAAGLDKNGVVIDEMSSLGFGFIEIGTVTPLPQDGNPTPRLFRLPKDKALINRMGFNNDGMKAIAARIKKRNSRILLGGNIGKNKNTANENAADDYIKCFNELYDEVDYFVVNVSSPNTPGLRDLQEKKPLTAILNLLQIENNSKRKRKPILLKIAPDLTNEQLDDIAEIVIETKLDGLIVSNTTIDRSNLSYTEAQLQTIGAGGLSGKPVFEKSNEVLKYISSKVNVPIIASGGIMTAEDALLKLSLGASLVQLYTGFVYEGPKLVTQINKKLIANL
ncbi:MAG: dihydroorotate dehydrogenase [Bacteroidota bacterium]|jgi:dihydroorotate dehydrogenase